MDTKTETKREQIDEPAETCLKQSDMAQAIQDASVGDLLLALIAMNKEQSK